MKRHKRLIIIAILLITGALGVYLFAHARSRQPHSELRFLGHTTNGVTHVVVFRLKCNHQRGELAGPGEVVSGAACFSARWVTNFSAKFPSNGEKEFAVIAPYDKTPWSLQLSFVQKPSELRVKLRTSWFLLKTEKTAAFPQIKAVWQKKSSIASMWTVMLPRSELDKLVWQQIVTSDVVGNPPPRQ